MALVVHRPFQFQGKQYRRQDIVTGPEADSIARTPQIARFCTSVADHRLSVVPPEPPAPADPQPVPTPSARRAQSIAETPAQ